MLRDSWKRPSVVVFGWATLLIGVFVLRGDLRVERRPAVPTAAVATAPTPVVVRPQRAAPEAAQVVRTGRIFDALGFLLVGAEVLVGDAAPVRSDADGRFEVALAAGAPREVTVQAPGHRTTRIRVHEATPEPLVVQLAFAAPGDAEPAPLPPLPLHGEGTVRDAAGAPVAGALVRALGGDAWARTDDTGRYRLALTDAAPTLLVHAAEAGLAVRSEPLQLERERGVVPLPELIAEPAFAVGGVVRDARGTGVAGVPVRLWGDGLDRLIETGDGGAFRIGGLEPGRYTVRPFAFRGAVGVPRDVLLDRPLVDCELVLQPLEEWPLRVLDEGGAPVAAASVAAEFAGERTSVQRTDAEGWTSVRTTAGPLDPTWRFDVRLGDDGRAATVRRYEPEPATLVVAAH